jgi:hypothetical protein
VVELLVGEGHRLSSWCAAGSSGAQRCKTPERAPRPRPAASAHQARAGRWTAAGHHAPVIERAVADQQHAHHRHQADPSLPPGQPRRVHNCLHAARRGFRSRPPSRSRRCTRLAGPRRQGSHRRMDPAALAQAAGADEAGCRPQQRSAGPAPRWPRSTIWLAVRSRFAVLTRAEVRLECDELIARLAAEPAVPAMNLLDNLADQLSRPRRCAGSRSCGPRCRPRWVGRSPFREAIAQDA